MISWFAELVRPADNLTCWQRLSDNPEKEIKLTSETVFNDAFFLSGRLYEVQFLFKEKKYIKFLGFNNDTHKKLICKIASFDNNNILTVQEDIEILTPEEIYTITELEI